MAARRRTIVPTWSRSFARIVAKLHGGRGMLTLSATVGQPVAKWRGGTQLSQTIANTRGSYPGVQLRRRLLSMLNAAGGWYEMSSSGHLMIIKIPSGRLTPRLLVDSHSGYQSRCETPAQRRETDWSRRPGVFPHSGVAKPWASRQSPSTPTFSDIRGQPRRLMEDHRLQFTAGRLHRHTKGQEKANLSADRNAFATRKRGLSGGDGVWTALTTVLPVCRCPLRHWRHAPQ